MFVHPGRGATDDNSPPHQRWEHVKETTSQSWKDVRNVAGQDRPSLRDWDDCLPNRDPAINRWAILGCPSGTRNQYVQNLVENRIGSTRIARTTWNVTKIRSVGCAVAASGLVPLEPEVGELRGHAEPSLPAPPPPRRAAPAPRDVGEAERERKKGTDGPLSRPTTFTSGTRPLGSTSLLILVTFGTTCPAHARNGSRGR